MCPTECALTRGLGRDPGPPYRLSHLSTLVSDDILCYSLFQKWNKAIFSLKIQHTIPHDDKKKSIWFFSKCIKSGKLRHHMYKYHNLRCIPFPLIIPKMFQLLKWSSPVFIQLIGLDFERHHKVPVHVTAQTKHEVKGTVCSTNVGKGPEKFLLLQRSHWAQWPPPSVNGRSSEPSGLQLKLTIF